MSMKVLLMRPVLHTCFGLFKGYALSLFLLFVLVLMPACAGKKWRTVSKVSCDENSIRLLSLSPTTARRLYGGSNISVTATVEYNLVNNSGWLSLLARTKDKYSTQLALVTNAITYGSGTRELSVSFVTPTNGTVEIIAYLVPQGIVVTTDNYEILGSGKHEVISIEGVSEQETHDLRRLASNYIDAVNRKDVEALEHLVHPDILSQLSREQLVAFRGYYLIGCTRQSIPEQYSLSCEKVSSKDLIEKTRDWDASFVVNPELDMNIEFYRSADSGIMLSVDVARKEQRWYLVFPLPHDRLLPTKLIR